MTREEHLQYIKAADNLYYDLGKPSLSDAEYDALRNDYIEKYGAKDLNYTPGGIISSKKFRHPIPVTSLGKVDESDTAKFDAEISRLSPIVVEPKYDGLTIVAYPQVDGSYQFVTRGNGIEGDILPWFISEYEGKSGKVQQYAIRGEAYLTKGNFDKMNKILVARGEEPKKNPRNAAAGILNPNAKERSEFMDFLSYTCYDVLGYDVAESEKLAYIKLKTPFNATISWELGNHSHYYVMERYNELKDADSIPIDGMVLKCDYDGSLAKFGSTGHHPRNAVAIKANQRAKMTVLRGVHWQVGKTGAVTPVADFDPIELLGSTVSQASLSNPDEIERLSLHIGDKIGVIKAREIIPKIVVNDGGGTEEIEIPEVCPYCGHELEPDGPILRCTYEHCPEVLAQKLAFIARKDVLNIPGLSIETCRKMVDEVTDGGKNYVASELCLGDLLWQKAEDFMSLPGIKEKSAQKLADAMQHAYKTPHPFRNWLPSLLIDGIGHSVADKLIEHFGSVKAFKAFKADNCESAMEAELRKIDGFGDVLVEKIAVSGSYFWDNWEFMEEWFPIQDVEEAAKKDGEYAGKTFVLTGKMPKKRSEYEALIKAAGGKVAGSVSKNTDYLVIADVDSTSSKAEKARELGTKLISPDELENLIG